MTPNLQAAAMRARAAQHCLSHPDDYPHVNRGMDYSDGYMDGCKNASAAILALPLEADHAELLAEAVKLAAVRALVDRAEQIVIAHGFGWDMEGMVAELVAALSALETP